jgi:hypothetical protein
MTSKLYRIIRVLPILFALQAPVGAQTTSAHHDKEFWRQIIRDKYRLPAGESPVALIDELNSYLSSPDPELRDTFGYDIAASWIYRDRLLSATDIRRLVGWYEGNLKSGIGKQGDDSIFLRSFSALSLSSIAALDNKQAVLSQDEFRDLLIAAINYMNAERDLRGYDPQKGWMHATAHTADLLKFLGRDPRLAITDQDTILDVISAKLHGDGHVFVFGENERMAAAVLSLIRRKDFDRKYFESWLAKVNKQNEGLWSRPQLDVTEFAAVQNTKDLLRSLVVQLSLSGQTEPDSNQVKEMILGCLKQLG